MLLTPPGSRSPSENCPRVVAGLGWCHLFNYYLCASILISLSELKGRYHRNLVLYEKLQTFFHQQKRKSIAQFYCRLSAQCTKTNDECLWPHMDLVRTDCDLKKVRLPNCFQVLEFSFPKCARAGHELFLSGIRFIFFLDALGLFCN